MTCIVGFIDKENKKVYIGGDSAGSSGTNITIRKDKKVFKNGEFIFGCTSSFRMIQLLRFSFKPPKIKTTNIYEYFCTDFINAIRECFKNGGYLQKYSTGDDKGGTFLVGYKNRLFQIDDDFQVSEKLDNYDAIGCGSSYALGSLYTLLNDNISIKEKIYKALKVSSYFSNSVCEPFNIVST